MCIRDSLRKALFHVQQEGIIGGDGGGEVEQAAQVGAQRFLVLQHGGGAEMGDAFAVGFQPGDIHAVERGAGHEADGAG